MLKPFSVLIAVALVGLYLIQLGRAKQKAGLLPEKLFCSAKKILAGAKVSTGESRGTWLLTGTYQDHFFQLKAIIDTLPTRKLPSLWLMVTLPKLTNVKATLDLMMRPAGPTTFSKFDFLPETLPTPNDFPLHAVIRTDDSQVCPPAKVFRPYLDLFFANQGKELLISPDGLRIVVQVAEVERVRYVVMREANFGETAIDPELVKQCLDTLLALSADLTP